MRRAAKSDLSQVPIVNFFRGAGCYVWVIGRPVDLLVRVGSTYITCECKTPGRNEKRRMPAQVAHAEDARLNGSPHFVLTCVEDAIRVRSQIINGLRPNLGYRCYIDGPHHFACKHCGAGVPWPCTEDGVPVPPVGRVA